MTAAAAMRIENRVSGRRERMIAAMRKSVTERGYAATSLDHVIAKVGGSRRNIYAEFGGKAGLMSAVVKQVVSEIATVGELPAHESQDPRDWLHRVGTAFTMRMLEPEVVAILREVIASGGVAREDVAALWDAGPNRFRAGLHAWLVERHAAGDLHVPDPDAAAEALPEMMHGALLTEVLVGRRTSVAPTEIREHVGRAVDVFLQGALPRR